jgi:hypothetical protein
MNGAAPMAVDSPATPGEAASAGVLVRRLNPRKLALGVLVLSALVMVGGMGLVYPIWDAPKATQLTRLIETAVTGTFIFFAILAADELIERGAPRVLTYTVAIVLAAGVGAVAGWHVRTATGITFAGPPSGGIAGPLLNPAHQFAHHLGVAIVCSLVGGLATFVHVSRRTALAARRRQQDAERARALARRRTLESQLQALQARVEPMFLFDTLRRIHEAYRADSAVASEMLEDLILYLRAALPHLRESTSTVSQELQLARAWLDIVGRSETRWSVVVDAAESARDARVPALVLLPLVQCAVAGAGVGPMSLKLQVEADGGRLSIDLSTGSDVFSRGVAGEPRLQQIDDRLRALYGEEARFACRGTSTGSGSESKMELPLAFGEPDAKPS